jgi:putative membrane protein
MKSIQMRGTVAAAALGALAMTGAVSAKNATQPYSTSPQQQQQQQQKMQPPIGSQEQTSAAKQQQSSPLTAAERNFLQSAAESNATEIRMAQLAEKKSSDEGIKKIGQELVKDHQAQLQQLEKLAASKGVSIVAEPTHNQQRILQSLESKSGADFDKQFIRLTQFAHERSISRFERVSRRATDPDLKSWASQTLPGLQSHLAMLKSSPVAVGEKTQRMHRRGHWRD